MANHYDIPSWAGKPPVGLHLDVMKGDKLIQKLMVDEKKCYLFGRNPQLNDFCIDHASCSRVHSAMVYHKHLNRAFLVDLASTHGTYIGSIRLEGQKPTQLPVDSTFHFGASTRMYILRERPQSHQKSISDDKEKTGDEVEGPLVGLPETEIELDNLTEFNTAHNRRISMLGIVEDEIRTVSHKKKNKLVSYNDEDEVINPEDIDPSVGRFRNLVSTTILPSRKRRIETGSHLPLSSSEMDMLKSSQRFGSFGNSLYGGLPAPGDANQHSDMHMFATSLSTKLGLSLPNPAPDVDTTPIPVEAHPIPQVQVQIEQVSIEPKKKKYAKEAWPGKKPTPTFLV